MSEHLTLKEITTEYGLSRTTIVDRCDKLGIIPMPLTRYYRTGRPPIGVLKTDIVKILSYKRKAREHVTKIISLSKDLKVTTNTVEKWCDELNITIYKEKVKTGLCNYINDIDVIKLIKRKDDYLLRSGRKINRTKSEKGNWNREHGLYHKITNYAGMIPA